MHVSWQLLTLAYIHFAAKIIVTTLLIAKRKVRRWPGLFLFCLLGAASDVYGFRTLALYNADGSTAHYALYYYGFYSWRLIAALLLAWVLADVFRSFPGAEIVGVRIPALFLSFVGSLAAGAGYLAFQLRPLTDRGIAVVAIQTELAVGIAWGVFLAGALVCIFVSRIGWSREGAWVCNGLIVAVGGKLLYGILTSGMPEAAVNDYVNNACNICGCAVWAVAALCQREVLTLPNGLVSLSHRLCHTTSEKVSS